MFYARLYLQGDAEHPIAPVMLGDAKLASVFADKMLGQMRLSSFSAYLNYICVCVADEGIYVIGFSYPVVPKGKARIRVQLSAAHTLQEVDRAVDAFTKIGRELNVISW